MKHIKLILIFVLLSIASFAQTKLYVATNGSDSNNGSINSPFQTIGYASDQSQPGDTILVRGGVYRNPDFNNGNIWDGNKVALIDANGAEDNYIVFMPYPNESVLIEFDGIYGFLVKNASYVKIIGFEFKGISDQITQQEAEDAWGLYKDASGVIHDLESEMGIDITDPGIINTDIDKPATDDIDKPVYYNGRALVANKSHHIEFLNNTVRDVPSAAIRVQQCDYTIVAGNEVYNNTWWTTLGVGAITVAESTVRPDGDTYTGVKIILKNNKVYGNENRLISWNPTKSFVHFAIDEGTGLFLTRNKETYDQGRILIVNNLSYNNGASGIVCHHTDRVDIEHNTVYKNGTTNHNAPGGIGVNASDDVKIINNISYTKPNKWALGILAQPVTNLVVENNIVFNDAGSEPVVNNTSFFTGGYSEINPLFLNETDDDFHLTASSPAIDAGSTNANQTDDFDGNLRDATPDIGAYEYIAAVIPPVTSVTVQGQDGIATITSSGGTLQMEATVLPAEAIQMVTWSVINENGEATINATGVLTAVADGYVTVRATATDGSSEFGETEISISNQTVSVEENKKMNLKIYPNPSKDFVIIEQKNIDIKELKVYNMLGEDISNGVLFRALGKSQVKLDITKLVNGFYIIKLNTYYKTIYKE